MNNYYNLNKNQTTTIHDDNAYTNNNFQPIPHQPNLFSNRITGNPQNQFQPITTNTQHRINTNPNISPFDKAYENNSSILGKIDHRNKGHLIHNNIGDIVLDEHIVEYQLSIDSLDRDIKQYPDPFSFIVKLDPSSGKTYQSEEYVSYKHGKKESRIVETFFEGTPTPHILKKFKNIKYIKLSNIILPQFTKTKVNEEGDYVFDETSILINKRFVSLVIDELSDELVYSTSENITRVDENGKTYTPPKPFTIIVPDKLLGLSFYTGFPYYANKIYKNSLLGNLDRLTIEFYDSVGQRLEYNNLMTYDELQQYEFDNGEPLPRTDLRHPLNEKIQVYMSFVIGVVENQINTETNFHQ